MAKKRTRKKKTQVKSPVTKKGVNIGNKILPFTQLKTALSRLETYCSRHSLLGYEGEFWKARVQVESLMEDLEGE